MDERNTGAITRRDFIKLSVAGGISYVLRDQRSFVRLIGDAEPENPDDLLLGLEEKTKPLIGIANQIMTRIADDYKLPKAEFVKEDYRSYHEASWYAKDPVHLSAVANPDDFWRWMKDDGSYRPSAQGQGLVIEFNPSTDPTLPSPKENDKTVIANYAIETVKRIFQDDTYRITRLILGTDNETKPRRAQTEWQILDFMVLNLLGNSPVINLGLLRLFLHELIHNGIPSTKQMQKDGEAQFIWTGDNYSSILRFYKAWYETVKDNHNFFKNQFFEKKNDGLLQMIKEDGGTGLDFAVDEIIAMLCTDYILPQTADGDDMGKIQWPPAVERLAAITWEIILDGYNAPFQPIGEEEKAFLKSDLLALMEKYNLQFITSNPSTVEPIIKKIINIDENDLGTLQFPDPIEKDGLHNEDISKK